MTCRCPWCGYEQDVPRRELDRHLGHPRTMAHLRVCPFSPLRGVGRQDCPEKYDRQYVPGEVSRAR